jgi:MFS transporter, PAT family, solute carrier family 33 (acetyl-CoA transportor), member 1
MSKKLAQNSLSNVGVTYSVSHIPLNHVKPAAECVSEHGKSQCADINGECVTERDGYYWVSALCLMFGVAFLIGYIIPTARKLQGECSVGSCLSYKI